VTAAAPTCGCSGELAVAAEQVVNCAVVRGRCCRRLREWRGWFVTAARRREDGAVCGGGRGRRWWREEDGGAVVVGARTVVELRRVDGGGCHGDGRW